MNAMDVGCGDAHAGAVVGGTAYFWGQNDQGQLGLGTDGNQIVPALIQGFSAWRQLASGSEHSCGLDAAGRVYCWGGNSRGQLGQGDRTTRRAPALVELPEPATSVATKFNHTCALLVDASLYCWGQNDEGQLGQADQPPSGDTTALDGLDPMRVGSATWRSVDTGQGHSCAISLDGGLWCWGRNSEHELGADPRNQVREPLQVTTNGPWRNIATGQNHNCGTMQDLTLWCWGNDTGSSTSDGPLGIPLASQLSEPTQVGAAANWVFVRTNTFHSCAINQDAELWCWGRNIEGQLGTADVDNRSIPTRITSDIASVSVGRFTTCVVEQIGVVACTGANDVGQLGTGDTERRNALTPVPLAPP
jgi:alpha-tubulin suppressor-like RCC1 family protein